MESPVCQPFCLWLEFWAADKRSARGVNKQRRISNFRRCEPTICKSSSLGKRKIIAQQLIGPGRLPSMESHSQQSRFLLRLLHEMSIADRNGIKVETIRARRDFRAADCFNEALSQTKWKSPRRKALLLCCWMGWECLTHFSPMMVQFSIKRFFQVEKQI